MSDEPSTPNYASDMAESGAMSIHERLIRARQHAGFDTAHEAAEAMNVKYSTYAGHENGSRGLRRAAVKYAKFFNVSLDWLVNGRGAMQKKPDEPFLASKTHGELVETRIADAESTPLYERGTSPKIKIVGRVAAGVFREIEPVSYATHPDAPFPPDPQFPIESQFDLVVEGNSINRFARDGEVLRCIDLYRSGATPVDGDLVVVRKTDPSGRVETTAKRARRNNGGWELRFDSDDPRYQGTLTLDPQAGEEIEITAIVLYAYRPARPLAALS